MREERCLPPGRHNSFTRRGSRRQKEASRDVGVNRRRAGGGIRTRYPETHTPNTISKGYVSAQSRASIELDRDIKARNHAHKWRCNLKTLIFTSVVLIALLPTTAFARGVVFFGPAFAPYGWYGPYYGMYPYGPYFAGVAVGTVKLDTKVKDAEVFVNGAYAGTVGQLKTMMMRSGDYDISIRAAGRTPFEQHIYVVAGKTLKLQPNLPLKG
jgi:hypothetical protein